MELHIINQSTNLPGGLNVKWKHRIHLLSAVLSADFILLAYLICRLAAPVTVREASAPEGTFEPEKYLALTFDDGPHPVHTPVLLDGLKERGVPATFFLMGSCIPGNEALVKRMQEEGHLIGNHSYNHVRLTKAGPAAVCEAVDRTSGMIENITGSRPQYMRPPYGDWNEELECQSGMTTVLWSVDSLDWKLRNQKRIVKKVLKEAEDGDIILMHDIFDTSVSAALELIDILQREGYTFVTADELMID